VTQLILSLACLFVAYVIYAEFLAQPKPITAKVAGNGARIGEFGESIINVLIEQVEQRRGPIVGTVGPTGKDLHLLAHVQAVMEDGTLILKNPVTPGTLVTVIR